MKTPEEIKDALLKHASAGNYCLACSYHNDPYEPEIRCADNMCYDAHEYIEILEDYNREIFKRMPKWISVKERLPENLEKCLTCSKVNGFKIGCYTEVGFIMTAGYWGEPTHWMPLPDLPREDCNE